MDRLAVYVGDVIEQPDYVIATIRRHLRDRGSLGA
jgi:hypothetical protein